MPDKIHSDLDLEVYNLVWSHPANPGIIRLLTMQCCEETEAQEAR